MDHQLSYASTPTKKELLYKTYVDMVKLWAEQHPEKDAFVEYVESGGRRSLTCKELLTQASLFGCYLVSTGLGKGDNVVICMSNSLNMIVAMTGVHMCGGTITSTSTNLSDGGDIIDLIGELSAKILIIDTQPSGPNWQITKNVSKLAEKLQLKKIVCNTGANEDLSIEDVCLVSFQAALEMPPEKTPVFPKVFPEDLAVYFKTSGSTGDPKLVAHPHYTWLTNSRDLNEEIGIDASSIYFCDRPFGWGVGSPRTFFASGSTRVFVDTRLAIGHDKIDAVGDIIAAEGCTHAYMPGYLVTDLINRSDLKHKFKTLNTIVCSGERIPKLYSQLIGQFCKKMCIWYGSTEMTGVSTFMSCESEMFEDGLIGMPMPGVEMKLVDANGVVVVKGEHGELHARSSYRFTQYFKMPKKFTEAIDSGNWFHTGDIGYVRPDGNFVLSGRSSELISMGTMKIFPFDIEKELIKCPGVVSAMAVPVPDVRLHNVICACVIIDKSSDLDLDKLREFCEKTWVEYSTGTGISLRPRFYLSFQTFLTNPNGKFDRRRMQQEANLRLGLS